MNEINSPEDLRRWCLEQAIDYASRYGGGSGVLDLAETYYQYVMNGPMTKEPVKQAA